jgi:uncharacterized repeat protein (TIGR01451 family)
MQNAPNPITRIGITGLARIAVAMWLVLSVSVGERTDIQAATRTDSSPSLQLALQAEPAFDPVRPSIVGHGDFITYTLTITNIGAEIQTQVVLSDGVPTGTSSVASSMRPDPAKVPSATFGPVVWEVPALNPSEVFTAHYTVRVSNYVTVTAIINKAVASSAETQPVQSNTTVHPFGFTEAAQLAISLKSDPPMLSIRGGNCVVTVGSQIRYTIIVTNVGALLVDTVLISSSIPSGTDFIAGSLYPTASQFDGHSFNWKASQLSVAKTFTATFKVRIASFSEPAFVNRASVESAQTALMMSNGIVHVFPPNIGLTPTPVGALPPISTYPSIDYCPIQLLYFPIMRR